MTIHRDANIRRTSGLVNFQMRELDYLCEECRKKSRWKAQPKRGFVNQRPLPGLSRRKQKDDVGGLSGEKEKPVYRQVEEGERRWGQRGWTSLISILLWQEWFCGYVMMDETGKITIWRSAEPTEQFRNRHYEPLAEKEMGFKKGRRCRRCGSSLSIYNGDKKCNSCLGRWVERKIICFYVFRALRNFFESAAPFSFCLEII